jgi:hypothetical protein
VPSATVSPETIHAHGETASRAREWAARWYPTGEFALVGVTDCRATVLVEIDGDIRIVRYEDLDAGGPRCEACGRLL